MSNAPTPTPDPANGDAVAWLRAVAQEVGQPDVLEGTETAEDLAGSLARTIGRAVRNAVSSGDPPRSPEPEGARAPDLDGAYTALLDAGGHTRRPVQFDYAQRVLAAFEERRPLAVEAGTGTGKTVGYLLAGFEHVAGGNGRRLLVATPTLALRDQVRESADRMARLGRYAHLRTATYKARSSYLCGTKAGHALAAAASDGDREAASDVLCAVERATQNGAETTVTSLACGAPCGIPCAAVQARERALNADVVATTHVSLARLSHPGLTGQDGQPKLAGRGFACVVDEADQFPDSVRLALRRSVTVPALRAAARLIGDARPDAAALAGELRDRAGSLDGFAEPAAFPRRRWTALAQVRAVERELQAVQTLLERGLRSLNGRGQPEGAVGEPTPGSGSKTDEEALRVVRQLVKDLGAVLSHQRTHEWLHTVDRGQEPGRSGGPLGFHREPFLLGALPGGPLPHVESVVFTSATLTPGSPSDKLGPFVRDAGVSGLEQVERVEGGYPLGEHVAAAIVDVQPRYDYSSGPTQREDWLFAVVNAVTDVAYRLGGRTLVLLTSRRDMDDLSERLRPSLDNEGYEVDTQDTPDAIEWFKTDEDAAVLLGVRKMWTGIDIRGRALTAVVVPRLPFLSPDAAEVWQVKEHEWDRWQGLFDQSAALQMRQAIGRIVRSASDRGLFVCLDGRLGDDRRRHLRAGVHPSFEVVRPDELWAWVDREARRLGLTPEVGGGEA